MGISKIRSSASLLEKTSILLSRNWKETSGCSGRRRGRRERETISDQMDCTGAELAIVAGAAELRDEGQDQTPGRKARAFIDLLHLVPAFDELPFDGMALLVVVGEGRDLEPRELPAQAGGSRVIDEPSGEDRAERGRIHGVEAKHLTLVPAKDGFRGFTPGSEVNMSGAGFIAEPQVADAGTGHDELITGGGFKLRKALQYGIADRHELALLPVNEAEALVHDGKRGSIEPKPDGIGGFATGRGSAGCGFLAVLFEEGEEFRAANLEAADPAGSGAALGGASPLDASTGYGDLGLIGECSKAIFQFLE